MIKSVSYQNFIGDIDQFIGYTPDKEVAGETDQFIDFVGLPGLRRKHSFGSQFSLAIGAGFSFGFDLSFCAVLDGKKTYGDGSSYEGQWKNGKHDGKGKMAYADGSTYEGEWKGDSKNGKGIMKYADGSTYEGEWKRGLRNGKGKLTASGRSYEGEWEFGLRNGKGKMILSGRICEGEWKDDERVPHSKGIRVTDGEYELIQEPKPKPKPEPEPEANLMQVDEPELEPEPEPEANLVPIVVEEKTDPDNNVKEEAKPDIYVEYRCGRIYEGQWRNDRPDGNGKMAYKDGSIYQGEWRDGKQHGQGKIYIPDKQRNFIKIFDCKWENGELIKEWGRMTYLVDGSSVEDELAKFEGELGCEANPNPCEAFWKEKALLDRTRKVTFEIR